MGNIASCEHKIQSPFFFLIIKVMTVIHLKNTCFSLPSSLQVDVGLLGKFLCSFLPYQFLLLLPV